MNLSKNFTDKELGCPCCGKCEVKPELVDALQGLRDAFGLPLQINSGFRCEAHNAVVGGAKNSQHLIGNAADIDTTKLTVDERKLLISEALIRFRGVGIGPVFIHVDVRPVPAMWLYDRQGKEF